MRYLGMFNLTRRSRNFASRKLIQEKPVRVRRRPSYLKNYYNKDLLSFNFEHMLSKYDRGEDIYFDKAPLPNSYFVNEIVLMPKNINTLFAYWEIREDDFKHLQETKEVLDSAVILLFTHDKLFRRIGNLPRYGSYYINNVEADKEYKAIIGFENANGDFFEIASSTYVVAPSGRVSKNRATVWGIPFKKEDNTIGIRTYTKEILPEESYYKQEILDNEIVEHTETGESIIYEEEYIGSSEKRLKAKKLGGSSSEINR